VGQTPLLAHIMRRAPMSLKVAPPHWAAYPKHIVVPDAQPSPS